MIDVTASIAGDLPPATLPEISGASDRVERQVERLGHPHTLSPHPATGSAELAELDIAHVPLLITANHCRDPAALTNADSHHQGKL